jgi:SNF2 family DNA or RNA helicase
MKYLALASQNVCKQFILRKGSCGLFVKMGVGKTAAVLTAIETLMYEMPMVRRVLIIAPLRVARITWPDEITKWDHTNIFSHVVLHGPKKNELLKLTRGVDLTIINYEGIQWAWQHKELFPRYDMVVLDESTFIKNPEANRSKLVKKLTRMIPRRIILTGSPTPNGIEDLWHQVFILDRGKRLGSSLAIFRERFMMYSEHQDKYYLRAGKKQEILDLVKDLVIVVESDDGLPDVVTNKIVIELPKKLKKQYDRLEADFFTQLECGHTIEALNQQSRTQKLRQFISGFVYDSEVTTGVVEIHTERVKALKELQVSLSGHNLLVAVQFQEDAVQICKYLKKDIPTINSLTSDKDGMRYIREWNSGELPMLLAHPASIGHGLNLQSGGNQIIWYNNTWSLEHYEQFIARLSRRGQKKDSVFNHIIVMKDTIDIALTNAVAQKDATQDSVLEYIKAWRKTR